MLNRCAILECKQFLCGLRFVSESLSLFTEHATKHSHCCRDAIEDSRLKIARIATLRGEYSGETIQPQDE